MTAKKPAPKKPAPKKNKKQVTAKIKVGTKGFAVEGQVALGFSPDYDDGKNKEWAKYTPSLSLSMTVLDSVAEHFEVGQPYTLTLTQD